MTAPDIAAIARGLTKAQRENLLCTVNRRANGIMVLAYQSGSAAKALERRGLIEGCVLTPLGLAVREHIIKENGGE